MCKFCTLKALDNYNCIKTFGINLGAAKNAMKLSLYYDKSDEGESLISASLWGGINPDLVGEVQIPIRFCPLCGEEINKNYSEEDG